MVSHQGFRLLGYVYSGLGTLGSFLEVLQNVIFLVVANGAKDAVQNVSLPVCLLALVFFVILLVGIWQNNLTLVKIYRVFLIASNVLAIIILTIAAVVYLGLMMFTDEKMEGAGFIVVILLFFLATIIGLYLLFLWIVNGVIAAIEYEQGANGAILYQPPDVNNKQGIPPSYAPV